MNKVLLLVLTPLVISAGQLGHNGRNFIVMENDRTHVIRSESLDSTLSHVNARNMQAFLRKGRISAHKTNDGSYVLRGHVNGLGGGPITGAVMYGCVKIGGWLGIIGGTTAVAAASAAAAPVAVVGGAMVGSAAAASMGVAAAVTTVESAATAAFLFGASLPTP